MTCWKTQMITIEIKLKKRKFFDVKLCECHKDNVLFGLNHKSIQIETIL